MLENNPDKHYMTEAIEEAKKAQKKGEVPVGAVLVKNSRIIARGHNLKENFNDPTSHAEIVVLRKAGKILKNWRITDSTLYVTLEPCLMCMGAVIQARIGKIVFSTFDPKAGACGSLYDISKDLRLNHRVEVSTGIMEKESGTLLKDFFKKRRKK